MSQSPRTADALLETVSERLQHRLDRQTVPLSRVSVGKNKALVAVDGGHTAGLVHRPSETDPPAEDASRLDATELARWAVEPPSTGEVDALGERALGVAALNALSAPYVDWRRGDPMAAVGEDVDVVATVGFFRPALDRFGTVDVRVVEREPIDTEAVEVPTGVSLRGYLPEEAEDAFRNADVLFLTGTAFVYGGAGRYLALAEPETTVVVIGATASFLPGPVFEAGADVIAGTNVTDVEAVVEAIADDACRTGLFEAGLQKVYVSADGEMTGLRLGDSPA